MKNFRKISQIIAYYILPAFLLILALTKTELQTFSKLGQLALITLTCIVFIKPIAVIFKKKILWTIVSFRRELGLINFWFFFFHFTGIYYIYNLNPTKIFNPQSFIFWGAMAGIGMIILTLTANNFSTKLLRKNWKKLHYLTYPVFLMALYHGSKAKSNLKQFYIVGGLFILLKIIQFAIQHKKQTIKPN